MLDEVLDQELLSGDQRALDRIAARREAYQRYRASLRLSADHPLVALIPSGGRWLPGAAIDYFNGAALHPPRPSLLVMTLQTVVAGSPGSAGRVEGLVRRIDSPEDGNQLQPGEILVTTQTDAAWTLLFPRAADIVANVGAPLSERPSWPASWGSRPSWLW